MPSFSFGQVDEYYIEGESLWRNQGYGVSNHKFDLVNFLTTNHTDYTVSPDPVTGSCSSEYYSAYIELSYSDVSSPYNTLKIHPYTVNTYSDYTNGVSAADLLAISWEYNHYSMHEFIDLSPTEDAPYRYISADADYDGDVDEDDTDMLTDLLLGIRYDLTRNSWDWVHKDEVENAEERFEEDPYAFVIDYNWPYPEGIVLSGLSTNEIVFDNDKFFTFRSTKIGDILANSSWTNPSANSWVCGSGYYFTNPHIESRTTQEDIGKKVRNGSIITLEVSIDATEEIYAYQLPVHYSNTSFELVSLDFFNDFLPRWNYNLPFQNLTFIEYSKDLLPLNIPNGVILQVRLKALEDIENIFSAINWDSKVGIETFNKDLEEVNSNLLLSFKNIVPPDLYIEERCDGGMHYAYIESPIDQIVKLKVFNEQGILVNLKNIQLIQGSNLSELETTDLASGYYILQVINDKESAISKFIIH